MSQALYELYDSDNPLSIPVGVKAAGYDDGYAANAWTAYGWARFPDALHITVFGSPDSDIFDIETGDGTPAQAGPWAVQRKARRKIAIPYCERVNGHAVEDSLRASGISVAEAMLWIATDDGTQVVTHWPDGTPVTYPVWAVQYLNEAHGSGGHYDRSLVYLAFGGGGGPVIQGGDDDMAPMLIKDSRGATWFVAGVFGPKRPVENSSELAAYQASLTAVGADPTVHTDIDQFAVDQMNNDPGSASPRFNDAVLADLSELKAGGTPPASFPSTITLNVPSVPGTATGKLTP